MDIEAVKKKVEELRQLLERHNYLYYVRNEPEITDLQYDLLMNELERIEKEYPDILDINSPTQRVGGESLEGFETIIHTEPMLSLSNTYSAEEVIDFDRRLRDLLPGENIEYVAELKIDGVAISLTFENGIFIKGATRGDGIRGDNVSQNIRTIKSIPMRILKKDKSGIDFDVRGEIFMETAAFNRMNEERAEEGIKQFVNSRNATAGSLKLLDSKEIEKRPLNVYLYYLRMKNDKNQPMTHYDSISLIESIGFPVNPYKKLCKKIDDILEFHSHWEENRDEIPFEVDGIVIKVNDLSQQERLGKTSKSPRWAVAFKFKASQAETILESIAWQVGRTGVITPVAHLKPVFLAGSTISRATLHNMDEIQKKDLREGDTVILEKGGDVIPKVVMSILEKRPEKTAPVDHPENCPVCGEHVKKYEGEVAYRCINAVCSAQIKRRLEHFASRTAMDIEGLGESIIDQLIEKKLVNNIADIYFLELEKLASLERMGEKSSQNLIDAINSSRTRPFDRILFALGIRFVGTTACIDLNRNYSSVEDLKAATVEELESIDGFGEKMAESVFDFFHNEDNLFLIENLKKGGVEFRRTVQKEKVSDILSGKTFVLTGKLDKFTRDEASVLIEDHGGKTSKSISKKTDFVLAGNDPGGKYEKALKLNVKIISESELLKMTGAVNKSM